MSEITSCTAFAGASLIAEGSLSDVAVAANARLKRDPEASILIFDDRTARPIDVDLRGSTKDVLKRLASPETAEQPETQADTTPRGPGRPKLGVVAREVTLLPRHWDWLSAQPGGASVALRKLVEAARKSSATGDQRRAAQEAAYRFMMALAGNEPGLEEATRALFASDATKFATETAAWPKDVRAYALRLAQPAL